MGTGRPFFQSSQRFDYYSSPEKAKKRPSPSPLQYSIKGKFGKEGASPNQQFSFGVSRNNMKKIHVDAIKKAGDKSSPGAGKYEYQKTFASQGNNNKAGLTYSMAANLPTEKLAL